MPTANRARFIMMNMYSRPWFSSPTRYPTAFSYNENGGGTCVDAELVLDRGALHFGSSARATRRRSPGTRHEEQRDAAYASGAPSDAPRHEVDDVLGQIVLAVGNKDFLRPGNGGNGRLRADRLGPNQRPDRSPPAAR